MLSFSNTVGRLLELKAMSPLTMADMMQGVKDIGAILSYNPQVMICCADFRELGVMADDVTAVIVKTMRADNPRIERSSYVLPAAGATAGLQWERLVREGLNPNRRLHRAPKEAYAWLDEKLDAPEKARMRAFYGTIGL